ncbi:receptor-like protein EIX2 [Henckelia pumila]|uniref:receptor-like protein EIX2 n=1 Tax=Henckelia pumila TaxID=405737 RepID=UPI003C6DC153
MMSIKDEIFDLLLFVVMLSLASGNNMIRCFDTERQALLSFKEELVDEHGRLSSWGTGVNKRECCKWKGVHCHNQTNHVTRLSLSGPLPLYSYAPLQGKISPSLLQLKHLNYLDLSHNDLGYSSIPDFIGSLNQLHYLNLSNSNFGGTVPQSIGNLSNLLCLDLSRNDLHSENLDWVSRLQSLEYLGLSWVAVDHKKTNWLQEISKLSSIQEIHWRDANLEDVPPSSLPSFNASTPLSIIDFSDNSFQSFSTFRWFLINFNNSLTFIDFSMNNITGPIFPAFQNLRSLAYLDLSLNILQGGIPKFFGNMTSLLHLNMQDNTLTAQLANLYGPLEKKLQHLDLSFNMMSGSLIDFSRFSSLTRLALGHNKFNGIIEKGYLNIPHLVVLDLSSNNFTGALSDLTLSPCLKELYLKHNMFNGPLKESIGNLSKLEFLFLGSNQLEDNILEAAFFNLSRLKVLELSSNSRLTLNCSPKWIPTFHLIAASLSGCNIGPRFPEWLRYQAKLVFLDISSNQIIEIFPKWFADTASQLGHLNVSNNQIHGVFPDGSFSTSFNNQEALALLPEIWLGSVLDVSRNRIMGPVLFLCNTSIFYLLDLSDNLFSEQLPECSANFVSSSELVNLANNNFSGKIPRSLCSESSIWLDLRNNSFSGSIPSFMRSCTSLMMLDLGNNRLTGEIPNWLQGSDFGNLLLLSLRANELHGAIPSSMCSLKNIQVLDLSSNNISGAIPKCLHFLKAMTQKPTPFTLQYSDGSMAHPSINNAFLVESRLLDGAYLMWKGHEVQYLNGFSLVKLLDLSNNYLVGEIPSEITQLIGLIGLNLSGNNLTVSIPQQIGNMNSYLDFLDLSRNSLSGGIPSGIWKLGVGILNLSYNNFSGRIPADSHFDDSSYIGNSLLCGRPILDKSCPGDYEPRLDSWIQTSAMHRMMRIH